MLEHKQIFHQFHQNSPSVVTICHLLRYTDTEPKFLLLANEKNSKIWRQLWRHNHCLSRVSFALLTFLILKIFQIFKKSNDFIIILD